MTARMLAALAVPAVLAFAPSSSTGQATAMLPANPQQAPVVTAADYARAERFLRENTMPLVSGLGVQPTWLAGDRFGYRITTRGQSQFILVNPSKGTRIACSPETDRCGGALDPREVSRLQPATRGPAGRAESVSPDGKRAAFIRNYN